MRTHAEIVQDASVTKVREVLATRDIHVSDPTVRSWANRPSAEGSIPSRYWSALADAQVATLEELAAHVDVAARAKTA